MYLLFDIGGTKIRIAAIKKGGDRFSVPRIIETPYSVEDAAIAIEQYGREIAGGEPVEGAIGGIAGEVGKKGDNLVYAPNLPNWMGHPIISIFEKKIGAPVRMMNDALMAAVGEAKVGAGKGFSIVAYITVGTGVGGARVIDGVPDRGISGFEVGHQIVDLDGSVCPDCDHLFPGRKGELETLVGGSALKAQTNNNPRDISDKSVWNDLAERLAAGTFNSILHWTPDVVVFGGSMITGDPSIPVDVIESKVKKRSRPIMQFPAFKKAELQDFGVLHGAMALIPTETPSQ